MEPQDLNDCLDIEIPNFAGAEESTAGFSPGARWGVRPSLSVARLRPDGAHNAAFLRDLAGVGKPHPFAAALVKVWANTPGAASERRVDLACPQRHCD
jgi:hypothetical protein